MPKRGARRWLTLLVAALALSLAACTGDPDEPPSPPVTATATPTATASPTATATPTATPSPTPTPTSIATPTATATPTAVATPTATPAPTPTATASPMPTATLAAGQKPPGIEFTPLALGEPRDLPAGVALYYGEHHCEGFHGAFRVVAGQNPPDLRTDRPWAFFDDRPGYVQSFEVAPSGQSLAAVVCERGYCDWGHGQPSDDATPAAWFSPDGGTTWQRWGEMPPYSSIVAVTDEDVALFDYGYRNGSDRVARRGWWFRSGEDLTPPEGLVDPYIVGWRSGPAKPEPIWSDDHSTAVATDSGERAQPPLPGAWPARILPDHSLLWSGRGPDGQDLFVKTDEQGAVLAAYSWDAPRSLHLIDHLGAELFVGELDRYMCSRATTVLVDLATATVRAVPGIDRDGRALFMLFAARPAPESPGPAATPSPTPPATATPTPTATPSRLRYDTYDTSGAVAEPGSYAFLADSADTTTAVTTYEGLRDGSATALRIHETDADGGSRAAFLDTVEVGDLFEWRQAEDCFVRYKVTELLPEPSGPPRRLLAVEWMTFTYTGCSGAISASDNAQIVWGSLPNLGGESLSVPVIHGAYEIVPLDWSGETMRDYVPFPDYSDPVETDDITVARTLDFWREPTIPEGWTFGKAIAAGGDAYGGARWGYCATWWANDVKIPNTTVVHPQRGVQICADFTSTRYGNQDASWNNGSAVHETRVIAGRPASLRFSPPGPNHRLGFPTLIQVFDPTTGVTYEIEAIDYDLKSNPEAVVEMARSLFEPPNPLPPQTAFRYDTYDTSGEVAEPGSYAFLADAGDTTSAVTTYEGLRDGTATALRIHATDADGVSRAAFLDTVEAGDTFEWRQAEDCFVRYRVTDVPEADATAARQRFAVRWETYVFQGCQTGSVPASGLMVTFTAADELPLEHLGGTNLADFAVVHGAWQLVPEGWTGATEKPTSHDPPAQSGERETTDIAVARTFPYWREPTLPAGWELNFASTGAFDGPAYGYGASFGPRGGVTIGGYYATGRRYARESSFSSGAGAFELLVIAGRPAMIVYSPPGPNHAPNFSEELWIYDAVTESEYVIFADHLPFGKDDVIAIARSLFEPPNPQ